MNDFIFLLLKIDISKISYRYSLMDSKSIIDDLKKYAGGNWTESAQKITDQAPPPADRTLADIVATVKRPFIVVAQNGVLSPDNATLNIRCGLGHMHAYFIRDLDNLKCYTCVSTRFVTIVREVAESILKVPFTLLQPNSRAVYELANDEHMVVIECTKGKEPTEGPRLVDDKLIISLPYSISRRKIHTALLMALLTHKQRFAKEKQDLIDAAIVAESNKRTFIKGSLPYTNEASDAALAARQLGNTVLGKMIMNVINDDGLYIENCKNK